MIQKYKHEIILGALLIASTTTFYYLYGILLPFILGLLLAFAASPVITKIQKIIRNRDVASTIFLATVVGVIILVLVFFTQHINKDFRRLNNSFEMLVADNEDNLEKTAQKVKEYVGNIYDYDDLQQQIKIQSDSLKTSLQDVDASSLDTESIKAAVEQISAVFQSEEEPVSEKKSGFSIVFMFFSTILYFILILYQLDYFAALKKKYFSTKVKSKVTIIADDFNQSFVKYFKLRTKIVLLLSLIYITAFIILDMPGMILLTVIIVLLSYVPYLQYLALIPLSVGCLVLSVEHNESFLLIFGIVAGVFILASIIEEVFLTPWIMEKNIGMNPVIIVLALSVWGYLLGTLGIIIGIPMTKLLMIYFERFILPSYKEVL